MIFPALCGISVFYLYLFIISFSLEKSAFYYFILSYFNLFHIVLEDSIYLFYFLGSMHMKIYIQMFQAIMSVRFWEKQFC